MIAHHAHGACGLLDMTFGIFSAVLAIMQGGTCKMGLTPGPWTKAGSAAG